jgi:predicted negative regulator of RcsB-dependent stress response
VRAHRIGVACVVGAALSWPLAAAEEVKGYAKEFQQAQSQQHAKRYRECLQACEKLLGTYTESTQAKEVTWLKIETQVLDSQLEGALKTLAGLAKAYGEDQKLQTAVALRAGDVQRLLKKPDDAIATSRKGAEGSAKDEPDQAAEALLRAGDVLGADLKKPEKALEQYQEAATRFATQSPKQAAEALRRVAALHETEFKDLPKAAAGYQALIEKYAAAYDERTLATLHGKAVDCTLGAKKPGEAIALAKKAEAALESAALRAPFGLRVADALLEMKKFPEARGECQRLVCAYPLEQAACQSAQAKMVEACRAESKWPEALGAARILYDAAGTEQGIRDAAQAVAQAFLSADGNLGRANEFLAYQSFGPDGPDGKPNTPDDIAANRLAEVKYPTFSAEADKQFDAAIQAQLENYDGYRARAFLYVYWGRPKEGWP